VLELRWLEQSELSAFNTAYYTTKLLKNQVKTMV